MSELVAQKYWEHWYQEIAEGDASLRQGDLLVGVTAFAFPQSIQVPGAQTEGPTSVLTEILAKADFVVFSASCDVARVTPSNPYVLLGPVKNIADFKGGLAGRDEDRFEVLRRGAVPAAFLLAEYHSATIKRPISAVSFRPHLTLPIQYVIRVASMQRRLRLRHPFREQFGAWIAANFGRIGVEDSQQVPPFVKTMNASTMLANLEVTTPSINQAGS